VGESSRNHESLLKEGRSIAALPLSSHWLPVMPIPDFFGPNLKVERANHHIGQLEIIFNTHISRNMERLRLKKKVEG
jgi:hypothetical protein